MSARVLVVDDNEDNVKIMSLILLGKGFEVRTARDGKAALRSIEQERPDVVLLDIMMPDMDGIEVLDRIRANPQSASLPVILVTGKGQDDDVLAGYKYGADYYITKPFTARHLLQGIRLVLGDETAAQ